MFDYEQIHSQIVKFAKKRGLDLFYLKTNDNKPLIYRVVNGRNYSGWNGTRYISMRQMLGLLSQDKYYIY